ncbi:MAG: flavin reductase family protein [Promethearchaeota archaeon]
MIRIKSSPYLIPKPVALIGALVDNKPNFFTVADICTSGYNPPRFIISSGKTHYTNKGIIENKAFSVNIPSHKLIVETDYCGIISGKKINKGNIFEVFYGEEIKTLPMIKKAPITHACKLVKIIDFKETHYLFIGEIVESYVAEDCLKGSIPNIEKVSPFTWFYDNYYRKVGEILGKAYKIGKEFQKK